MAKEMSDEMIYQNLFAEYPDVVTVDQMCDMLDISTVTAYRLLKSKKIQSLRIGHVYKIPKLCILQFLNLVS